MEAREEAEQNPFREANLLGAGRSHGALLDDKIGRHTEIEPLMANLGTKTSL